MEKQLFERCMEVILKNEGGYVNNPNDPGGETKYGIAKRYNPDVDIKKLTIERAKNIYYEKYWKPANLYGIKSDEIVLQIFDFGVNAGIKTAIMIAQELAGVKDDGYCGPVTKNAINNLDQNVYLRAYKIERIEYYRKLSNFKHFGAGWIKRVNHTTFKKKG